MAVSYNIPVKIYENLLSVICEEYDEKLKRISTTARYTVENRYKLPTTVKDKTVMRMGVITVYIIKAPEDPFDIEYTVAFRLNAKIFIDFVNKYLNKHNCQQFSFDNWAEKDEFFDDLSKYISKKYYMKTSVYQTKQGGYIQFDIRVFMHGDTRIIYFK